MRFKKLLTTLSISSLALFALSACDGGEDKTSENSQATSEVATSQATSEAATSSEEEKTSEKTSEVDTYSYESNSGTEYVIDPNYEKNTQTVFMVGDSTMCGYEPLDPYYYPRYGYGTQLINYLDSEYITV
ncbi:MAG: hypothetical protein K6E20_07030, partial [Acholeplasmatales bacterium]|nr:hypothetical protein [Acholeplasmatales bacterium]